MSKFKLGVLILNIFLCSRLKAQENKTVLDIFAHENLLDLKDRDLIYSGASGILYINKMAMEQYSSIEILKNVQERIYLNEKDASLKKYNISNIDSVLELMSTGNWEKVERFTDSLYIDSAGTMKGFFDINTKACGKLNSYELVGQDIIHILRVQKAYLIINYKAVFAKASGVLQMYFRLSPNNKFLLATMEFKPYDDQRNSFVTALAQNDLQAIKSGDHKSLEGNFTEQFAKKIENRKVKFEDKLSAYKIADVCLTYRIFRASNKIYVVEVFTTDKKDNLISIRYLFDKKKFLIDEIAVIDES